MSVRRCRSRRIDQPGLGQHTGPDERLECGLERQIDPAAEQGSELTHHRRKAQQSRARAGQEIDQQVEVAVLPHLAARSRTEQE